MFKINFYYILSLTLQSYIFVIVFVPPGHLKPDVIALGASVLTIYAHEEGKAAKSYDGTSFSGPVVAGNVALVVRQ